MNGFDALIWRGETETVASLLDRKDFKRIEDYQVKRKNYVLEEFKKGMLKNFDLLVSLWQDTWKISYKVDSSDLSKIFDMYGNSLLHDIVFRDLKFE